MKPTVRVLAVLLTLLFVLPSCGRAPKKQSATLFAMDTYMELTVYGKRDALTAAEAEIRTLEEALSVTDSESGVAALNRTGTGAFSPEISLLISETLALCECTGGALDITVYPLVRAWGFTTGNHRVPDEAELAELLTSVGYDRVTVSGNTVTLAGNTEIDLGAVGKGYTADRLTALLRDAGVTSALLNLGGNVQAIGTKPNGDAWRVGVQDPSGEGVLTTLEVSDCAVVTSGTYERYFEQDGEIYHHIIDPKTGSPAKSGLSSVTVVAKSGLLADALSTALFVMGKEQAIAHWKAYRDFEAIFVTDAGELFLTDGLRSAETDARYAGKVTVIEP